MFRVCTYPDPFNINKNSELWELISKNPQFCASQTLVQGMNRYYNKSSFYFIQTVQTLLDNVYSEWNNNFDNDIKIYLSISEYIKNLSNETLKSSLKYNISEIVQSIKLLIIMRASHEMFDDSNLSFEQQEILKIYDYICTTKEGKIFEKYDSLTKKDLTKIMQKCLLDDINNYIEREEMQFVGNHENLLAAKESLLKLKSYFKEKLSGDSLFANLNSTTNYADKIKEVSHYINLIDNPFNFDTIVFHGVHKITPLMYFLFKTLDVMGINVVFVINYMKNYPNICNTWNRVYSWTKCKFEYVDDLINMYNDIGKQLGNLFEDSYIPTKLPNQIFKFKNLTQFTDEVSSVYSQAKKDSSKSSEVLSRMKTQYYAIDSEDSNKILKIYYPEQFGSKHFLSYPIGQFILNLYNMWNSKEKKMIVKFSHLYECINAGLILKEDTAKLYNIAKKVELYFPEESDINLITERLANLKTNLITVKSDNSLKMLKRISFYSLESSDIELFEQYINNICEISQKLFKDENIKYKSHFQKLMEIVSSMVNVEGNISKIEMDLINEINTRLSGGTNDEIEGSIEDVQQAIFYYLSSVKESDSSNWIVRGFDQIDGGVLLSKSSKSKAYHFALCSNNHLCGLKTQELPYPLTIDMFKNYEESDSCINVMYEGFKEQRNYLRFYLFYGLMFAQKNLEISYIENETEGEEQEPYYALKALGLEQIEREETIVHKLKMEKKDLNQSIDFNINSIEYKDKELFSICPYKYFLSTVLNQDIVYSSDYHVKYYCSVFFTMYFATKYNGKNYSIVEEDINKDIENMKKLFSFMIDSEFYDVVRKFKEDFQTMFEEGSDKITQAKSKYLSRKMNFLIAQWREKSIDGVLFAEKQMRFPEEFKNGELEEEIYDYMNNPSTHNYEIRNGFPHPKVCENCNYSEVCLRRYYEVLEDEYNDFINGGEDK